MSDVPFMLVLGIICPGCGCEPRHQSVGRGQEKEVLGVGWVLEPKLKKVILV